MRFLVLGPVEAWDGGVQLELGRRKQRFVLALLLLEANRLVSMDRLVDLLWPESPPASARSAIQSHVSRLRRVLADAGAERHGVTLHFEGNGYRLRVDPALVDVHCFRALVDRARVAADDESRVTEPPGF